MPSHAMDCRAHGIVSVFFLLLAGVAAAASARCGAAQGGPDAVSLLQVNVAVHDPLDELKAGVPQLERDSSSQSELALARTEPSEEGLDTLALQATDPTKLDGVNTSEKGNVSGKHRVALDPRKFGDLLGQVTAQQTADSKCCLEGASSAVHSRTHAANRTRILEKLKMAPGGENSSKEVDPEVKEEIGEMIVKVNKVLDVLMRAGHRGNHPHLHLKGRVHTRPGGFSLFFRSVAFFDWCLLAVFILFFFILYSCLLRWRHRRLSHGITLGAWLVMATIFGLVIWLRQGESSATLWVSGFILELIFLVENVFVFHIVISAFKLSHRVLDNALFVVVGFQLAFQMVFYMGLASALTHWTLLPYILGVWLLYVGYHAAFDDDQAEFNVMESRIVRGARWLLGSRLLTAHEADSFVTVGPKGKYCLTVGGLCVAFLLVADFLLEIDVTLAKIEGLGGAKIGPELEYICFSSSAVATFTVPELYFVARDIFARLRGLKYGIALVISYLGVQMLLGTVYTVPLLVDVAIFLGVLIASCITSVIVDNIQAMQAEQIPAKSGSKSLMDDHAGDRSARRTWNGVCSMKAAQDASARSTPPPPETTPETTPEDRSDASISAATTLAPASTPISEPSSASSAAPCASSAEPEQDGCAPAPAAAAAAVAA